MPFVTFIDNLGSEHTVEAKPGTTVMQAALDNLIDGIIAECGGSCSCGTCHCYVDERSVGKLPPAGKAEIETLECSIGVKANSRLSCQIVIREDLDGMVVRLPESQI
jgi:2Fe-2S ferredoxin